MWVVAPTPPSPVSGPPPDWPAAVAPPPPAPTLQGGGLVPLVPPPFVPWAGLTGGVLPVPPFPLIFDLPPPPEPPLAPFVYVEGLWAPLPPPADVIVEKIEFDPFCAVGSPGVAAVAPPAPTVIGYVCAESVIPAGAFNGETV